MKNETKSDLFDALDNVKEAILNEKEDLIEDLKETLFAEIVEKTIETTKKLFNTKEEVHHEEPQSEITELPARNVIVSVEERLKFLIISAVKVINDLNIEDKEQQIEELVKLLESLPTYYTFLRTIDKI
jgi:hypothetical protein